VVGGSVQRLGHQQRACGRTPTKPIAFDAAARKTKLNGVSSSFVFGFELFSVTYCTKLSSATWFLDRPRAAPNERECVESRQTFLVFTATQTDKIFPVAVVISNLRQHVADDPVSFPLGDSSCQGSKLPGL
jgi:hypothetical protein